MLGTLYFPFWNGSFWGRLAFILGSVYFEVPGISNNSFLMLVSSGWWTKSSQMVSPNIQIKDWLFGGPSMQIYIYIYILFFYIYWFFLHGIYHKTQVSQPTAFPSLHLSARPNSTPIIPISPDFSSSNGQTRCGTSKPGVSCKTSGETPVFPRRKWWVQKVWESLRTVEKVIHVRKWLWKCMFSLRKWRVYNCTLFA